MGTKATKKIRASSARKSRVKPRATASVNQQARKAERPPTCAHCGCFQSAHYAVSYADGQRVSGGTLIFSGTTLVCPTSTFLRG